MAHQKKSFCAKFDFPDSRDSCRFLSGISSGGLGSLLPSPCLKEPFMPIMVSIPFAPSAVLGVVVFSNGGVEVKGCD